MSHVISVNVSKREPILVASKQTLTGIYKQPISGRANLRGISIEGDEVGSPNIHGGYDQAVYAYASEDYAWWAAELDRVLLPGMFGENLTTTGVDVSGATIGEQWRVGDVILEASAPRFPCATFQARMDLTKWVETFTKAMRPGAYLRIVREGSIGAGDPVEVVERPDHGMTIREFFRLYTVDRPHAGRLLTIPHISEKAKSKIRAFLPGDAGNA